MMSFKHIKEQLEDIKIHTSKMNEELGQTRDEMIVIRTDVAWLKKFQWIIITASVGALVANLIQILR